MSDKPDMSRSARAVGVPTGACAWRPVQVRRRGLLSPKAQKSSRDRAIRPANECAVEQLWAPSLAAEANGLALSLSGTRRATDKRNATVDRKLAMRSAGILFGTRHSAQAHLGGGDQKNTRDNGGQKTVRVVSVLSGEQALDGFLDRAHHDIEPDFRGETLLHTR